MKRWLLSLLFAIGIAAPVAAQNVLSSTTCPGTGCEQVLTQGAGSIGVQVVGTFSGTLTFEGANDDATWSTFTLYADSASGVSSTTAAGMWRGTVAGIKRFRVRFSVYTSGTASIYTTLSTGTPSYRAVDSYGAQFMRQDHPNRFSCTLTTSATTSTALTNCAAPGAGLAYYVTDISVYGGVAVGATAAATVQSGTGGTCGSATVIVTYCQHTATAGCTENLSIARRAVTNGEMCLLDATVGTKFAVVSGFIAP